MKNLSLVPEFLTLTIGLSAIWMAYFYLYRDYLVDSFRQEMFSLRDKFFNEASDGLIDFDHPAYCLFRRTMNGYLRFGHKISFAEIMLLFFFIRKDKKFVDQVSFEKKWEDISLTLDVETKNKLDCYRKEMSRLLVKHILMSSPFFVCCLVFIIVISICLILPFVFIILLNNKIKEKINDFFGDIESTAMSYGR